MTYLVMKSPNCPELNIIIRHDECGHFRTGVKSRDASGYDLPAFKYDRRCARYTAGLDPDRITITSGRCRGVTFDICPDLTGWIGIIPGVVDTGADGNCKYPLFPEMCSDGYVMGRHCDRC